MLRFAILRMGMKEGEANIALEYDEELIRIRLVQQVSDILGAKEKVMRRSHSRDEISKAVTQAFNNLITEFKNKSVKIL